MAAEQQDLWGAALAGLGKLWPNLIGALLSLKFQPAGSTFLQRAFSGAGGADAKRINGHVLSRRAEGMSQ